VRHCPGRNSRSPLTLFEDGLKDRVCSRGDTGMEEEEDDGMIAEDNRKVISFPCNVVSTCNEGVEMLNADSRSRRTLLGLIPVKISTSNQCLNNRLSDSVVRNCNKMFWMNNKNSGVVRV